MAFQEITEPLLLHFCELLLNISAFVTLIVPHRKKNVGLLMALGAHSWWCEKKARGNYICRRSYQLYPTLLQGCYSCSWNNPMKFWRTSCRKLKTWRTTMTATEQKKNWPINKDEAAVVKHQITVYLQVSDVCRLSAHSRFLHTQWDSCQKDVWSIKVSSMTSVLDDSALWCHLFSSHKLKSTEVRSS